ncbi:MAG TPA: sulfurtransferase [Anaerolineales bacterium]|nr:sulfurtransferase [Anaerolineales bacterium]
MSDYIHPEVLVETNWLVEHLNDQEVRIVEADEDVLLYDVGHIPGAVKISWHEDLNDARVRDYLDAEKFAALLSSKGISNATTVVFYGDKNNWWATYNFWVFKLFGHKDVRVLNGGRKKWEDEKREFTKEVPSYAKASYKTPKRDDKKIRVFRDDVLNHVEKRLPLVDVRSPAEYTGEKLHMPEYPQEGALRGGHIPGAKNIPWAKAVREDGTFKSVDELKELYQGQGITPEKDIVTYCRIGERSSHSWFVLTYLLGYPNVRNYDGSWTEWGNLVRAPIEK